MFSDLPLQLGDRGNEDALARCTARLDDCGRRIRGQPVSNETRAQLTGAAYTHIDRNRRLWLNERRPVEVETIFLKVAGHEHARLRVIAVGKRYTRITSAGRGRSDARYHLKVNALRS